MKKISILLVCLVLAGIYFYSIHLNTKAISFEQNGTTIKVGEQLILTPTFPNKNIQIDDCIWSNLSPDVIDLKVNNDKSISIIGKDLGKATVKIEIPSQSLSAKCDIRVSIDTIKKWIAFGNSITKHPITPFWWGEWGMAADKKEKDYVHVLNALLQERYKDSIAFEAVNIADWENDFNNFDKNTLSQYLKGDEDLIIIRLGENVPNNDSIYVAYEQELRELLQFIKSKSPQATYVLTGNFWENLGKDKVQKKIADENYCIWVPLSHLNKRQNKTTEDAQVFGNDGQWHTIAEGGKLAEGVANHPGNKGMYKIARSIYQAITK